MQEPYFHAEVDKLFLEIEQWLEKSHADIDFESQEGILTVSLGEGRLVLSRQTPAREIWLASPLGAYHFRYTPMGWVTQQGHSLLPVISQIVQQCAGIILDITQIKS
jgi:CyaY protein